MSTHSSFQTNQHILPVSWFTIFLILATGIVWNCDRQVFDLRVANYSDCEYEQIHSLEKALTLIWMRIWSHGVIELNIMSPSPQCYDSALAVKINVAAIVTGLCYA